MICSRLQVYFQNLNLLAIHSRHCALSSSRRRRDNYSAAGGGITSPYDHRSYMPAVAGSK